MRVTIKDIARECGVSVSTVSLALSNKPSRVAKATKNRVIKTAERLNYQPNRAAVSLVTNHSKLIGLVISDLRNAHVASFFMAIDLVVQRKGYALLCHILNDDSLEPSHIVDEFMAANVEGIILGQPYVQDSDSKYASLKDYLNKVNIPIVTRDIFGLERNGADVCTNYFKGGYMATKHLIEYGHSKIGCLCGDRRFKVTKERLEGYKYALEEARIKYDENMIFYGDYTMASGSASLPYFLKQKASAIFSFNDEMAFGIFKKARQEGVVIPRDLSLIGFDNIPYSDIVDVPLTTIHVPIDEIGKRVAQEIMYFIENDKDDKRRQIMYEPELILRESTIPI